MPAYEDVAICVRVWDWSETSQTVSVLARELGLLRCLAKGSKRPKAPFSGGIELLTVGAVGVNIKPGRDLSLLTRWDLAETFPALRKDLGAHRAGLYVGELVMRLTADHDPHPGLFDAARGALAGLDGAESVPGVLVRFQMAALREAGYRPVLDRLLPTGEALPEASAYRFDPIRGGLVVEGSPTRGAGWLLRRGTVELLGRVAAGHDGAADLPTQTRAARFLAAYTRHVLGEQPATLALLFPDLGPDARA